MMLVFVLNLACLLVSVISPAASWPHHLQPKGEITEPCDLTMLPPDLWTRDADVQGRMLIGTTFAQSYIWDSQHPPDCSDPQVRGAVFFYKVLEQFLCTTFAMYRNTPATTRTCL